MKFPILRPASVISVFLLMAAGPVIGKARRRVATVAPAPEAGGVTRFQMRRVHFHVDEALILEIATLRGELLPGKPGVPPTFDDRDSLILKIDGGEAAMSTASFAHLLNRYVFNYRGAPLSDIRVGTEGDLLRQQAILHKGVDVPTEIIGSLHATEDGRVRFHPKTIRAAGVPAKGLLDTLGLTVDKLVQGTDPRGVETVGDDLILDLDLVLPPPRVRARVTGVRVEGDRIVMTFGPKRAGDPPPPELKLPDPKASNYLYFRGGTVRFRKLTMVDTDLLLVDARPGDAFDFSLARYYDQLVAGYSKSTPTGGLITRMPDVRQLRRARDGETSAPDLRPPPPASPETAGPGETPAPSPEPTASP